ncbi:MAG TPA: cellulase family glycosylhydrolase [Chitinophagaceae bacterium]
MNRFALLIILVITLTSACKKSAVPNPASSFDPLAKGINLSNWFNDYSDPLQYSNRFSAATLQLIKTKGFTYVRIPVGPVILFDPSQPAQLNPVNLPYVDNAISRCINAGLAVTINLHPLINETDSLLANNPGFVNSIAAYWKSVALSFKKYPPDKLFFEVYNEPHASAAGITSQNYSWWQPVQEKLITAIREVTSTHYIIAGGEGWNSIDGLLQLHPYNDSNIIYDFHFYDPFLFTHQGASWSGWQPTIEGRNIPYPSSPDAVAPLMVSSNSAELNNELNWYACNASILIHWTGGSKGLMTGDKTIM